MLRQSLMCDRTIFALDKKRGVGYMWWLLIDEEVLRE